MDTQNHPKIEHTPPESPLSFFARVARRLRCAIYDLRESRSEWRRKKRLVDHDFDRQFNVDTGGVTYISALRIHSQRRRHAVNHVAMDPGEMQAALQSLSIDHTRFTFVDLGSGKGRALLLASLLPFKRIVGVEFAEALHRDAVENLRKFSHPQQRCRDIELLCADAAAYAFPREPLVVFMYNPFGPEVMREIVQRVRNSLAETARELYVLYANPFHVDLWKDSGFVEQARGGAFVLLKPA